MALGLANNQHYPKTSQGKMLSSRHSTTYQHNQRPIAPAPAPYTKVRPTSLYAAGTTLDSNNPAVVRRNARERNRVKQVNNGFTNLRQHIPVAIIADLSNGRRGIGPGANKKLSKVDTLRMAVEYIRRLKRVIDDVDNSDVSSVSSFNSSTSSDMSNSSSPPSPPSPASPASQSQASQSQPAAEMLANNSSHSHFKAAQYYFPGNASYAFTFDKQQQQQHNPNNHHQQPQQQQTIFNHHHHMLQQAQLVSPAASISSSTYSTDSYYQQSSPINNSVSLADADAAAAAQLNISKHASNRNGRNNDVQVKFEQCYDEYPMNASTDDEEDILDYISLWQDEL